MMYKKACDVPGKDNVKLGIGSIQYIHVPRFLSDLYRSVSLFHEYIENAKQRIRHAASEVAEFFVKPNTNNATPAPLCDMELDVTLDAPLLVLPCSDRSTQVLVAELGRMVISNATELSDSPTRYTARDIIDIRIRDIKLVAKEVDPPKIDTFTQEVIVEEAGINLTIIHNQILENQTETSSDGGDFHLELSGEEFAENTCRKAVSLSAEVPHPLQVSLSRQAYDLLLQAVQTASSTNDSGSDPMKMHAGKGQESTTSHLSSNSADAMLYVSAALTVPIVSVAIKDQLGGTETEGIIKLQLEELSLAYEKKNPYIASLKLQLSSLSALDLLQPEDSKHRYLALSLNKSHQREAMPKFVSTSLPGTLIKSRKRKLYDHDFSVSHPLSISSHCIKVFLAEQGEASIIEGLTNLSALIVRFLWSPIVVFYQ
ncbi:intermembrane lipid transfer protein Vps13D-like [Watersipora subatra]|uniref:intermembrane lipid transfer protein Vps13D-like n=1 Tax=Watersipora subatra TaxID=2589382 RepID=UPI00355BDDB4